MPLSTTTIIRKSSHSPHWRHKAHSRVGGQGTTGCMFGLEIFPHSNKVREVQTKRFAERRPYRIKAV